MWVRRLSWLAAVAALAACQTITEELPQTEQPNPGAPAGTPVVVVPVPVPSPQAPSPTPPPSNPNPTTPTPAPTAAPTEPPTTSQGCPLPPGRFNENCVRESSTFLRQVETAIDDVIRNHPSYFDTRKTRGCGNCYLVVNPTAYVNAVAASVTRNGVCGYYDGEELAVKNTNSFNDQFDILTSDLFIRRQEGSYRSTCRPAWF